MARHLTIASLLIGFVLAGAACKKDAPPERPEAPAKKETPAKAEAPAETDDAAAAETPPKPGEPQDDVARARAARAAELGAQKIAAASSGQPALGGLPLGDGTADCESGKKYDTLSVARQKATNARAEAEKAAMAVTEAENEVNKLLYDAFNKGQQDCRDKGLDPTCLAAVSGNTAPCATIVDGAQRMGCESAALLTKAAAAKDASICAGIADDATRALCTSALSGTWACGEGDEGPRKMCRMLEAKTETCPAGEECADFWSLRAVLQRDARLCDAITDDTMKARCRGLVTGDKTTCKGQGPAPTDCRDVVVASEVITVNEAGVPKSYLQIKAANVYEGTAACTVSVQVRAGGAEQLVERELPPLTPEDWVKTFSWEIMPPAGNPVVMATSKCEWSAK